MRKHFLGVVQTVWSGSGGFLDTVFTVASLPTIRGIPATEANCFKRVFEEIATHQ